MGTSLDYAPFSIAGAHAEPTGFDVDVARRLAADLGRPLVFVPMRWPALLDDLANDQFDVAMSGVTIRPERALVGTFTRPVATTGAVLLVPNRHRPAELRPATTTLRIGVNAGGHLERVARTHFPRAHIVPITDNQGLPAHLASGRVDALLTDTLEAPRFMATLPGVTQVGPFTRDRKAYLVRDSALADAIDAWLRARESDGFLAALRTQWFGAEVIGPAASDVEALLSTIDLRAQLMPEVARAKAARGLPIVDERREEALRRSTLERAATLGLPAEATTQFIDSLIHAARHVQAATAHTPTAAHTAADLDRTLRPALDHLTKRVLDLAAFIRASPDRSPLTARGIAESLDPLMPAADRAAIAAALVNLLDR